MGKRPIATIIVTIVLSSQFVSTASAGYFNWLKTTETDSILVQSLDSNLNNISRSETIWDHIYGKINETEDKPKFKVTRTHIVRATGYSSTPDQTDDTPFITASGAYVRDGIIAANFYLNGKRVPFGTLVRIPEIYGEKIFIVEDRMNARYTNNIDIWFPERNLARQFGSKQVTIEIVQEVAES